MKTNLPLFLSFLVAAQLLAQSPAAVTNAPATKPAAVEKKSAAKKAKTVAKKIVGDDLRSQPLVPGPASVVATNVNVRGRAGLIGEVLTKISQGDMVTVLEEITLKNSKDDEPSAWARIVLPPGAHVWVNTAFIDETTKTVKPRKLNLRGGPGENYSVIGTLVKGAAVKEVQAKGDWTEIEAPGAAFAFVAAQYLKQELPAAPASTPAPEPAPTPAPVTEPKPVATTTTDTTPAPIPSPAPALPVVTPEPAPAPTIDTNSPRIVQREGIVKGTWSIQAPTRFALTDLNSHKTINYLYTTSTNLDLRRWKGLHIVVTGEEGLDERWKNTPVLTIQRIQVID